MGRRTVETKAPQEPASPASPVSSSRRDPIADWLDLFLRMLSLPKSESAAVRDELEDHLRSRVDDLLITGSSEHDAVLRAVSELGETAELARRFKQASHPSRRRHLMSTALIAIAGSALTLGAFTVFNPPTPPTTVATLTGSAAGGNAGIAAFVTPPGEAAPFNDKLRKYDVSMFFTPELEGQWGEMHPNERINRIAETIQDLVSNESWIDRGGADASITVTGNTMFITGDEKIHEGVAWVRDTLIADLNKERAAYEAKAAERIEEGRARFEKHLAETEARMLEQQQAQRRAEVEAEAKRQDDLMRLRSQYEALTSRYVDTTRELAKLRMEHDRLDTMMSTNADRVGSPFVGEINELSEVGVPLRYEQTQIKRNLLNARNDENSDPVKVDKLQSEFDAVSSKIREVETKQSALQAKISELTRREYQNLQSEMAILEGHEAEVRLEHEDTQVRLERIRSVMLDLELAEYQPSPKPLGGYTPQPSPTAPQASETPAPSADPLSAR